MPKTEYIKNIEIAEYFSKQLWSIEWFQYILNNIEKNWNWHSISINPNITWEIVKKYKSLHLCTFKTPTF